MHWLTHKFYTLVCQTIRSGLLLVAKFGINCELWLAISIKLRTSQKGVLTNCVDKHLAVLTNKEI